MAKEHVPATCKGGNGKPGCGARIRWPRNPSTKRGVPVDFEPSPNGNIAIEGNFAIRLSAQAAAEYQGDKYVSHFATCPYASQFRSHKPHAAPARPADIRLGTFDSPAAAAVGRIEADALDITVTQLSKEFCDLVRTSLGDRPTEDELQHKWKDWKELKREAPWRVDNETLALVAKRARPKINVAEVTHA